MFSHKNVQLRRVLSGLLTLGITVAIGLFGSSLTHAANVVDVINVYVAPPLVQGTYLSSGITVENFNTYTAGTACPTALSIGAVSGGCRVENVGAYGGATAAATSSTATVGGIGSKYATTTDVNGMTFSLTKQSRYVGFWWSAGGGNNHVTFYQDDTEIVSLNSQDLYNLFGTAPTNASSWTTLNSGSNELSAVDGSTHRKVWYFGNPRGYASTTPTGISSVTSGEPFVYVHLFAKGNLSFNKVKFSGGGFEFDNLVVAEAIQQLPSPNNLVLTKVLTSPLNSVTYHANGGDGTMSTQFSQTAANLSTNSFSRSGYSFGGWANSSTNADVGAVAFTDGQSYAFSSDATLYAIWIPDAAPNQVAASGPATEQVLAKTGTDSGLLPLMLAALAALGVALLFGSHAMAKRRERI